MLTEASDGLKNRNHSQLTKIGTRKLTGDATKAIQTSSGSQKIYQSCLKPLDEVGSYQP